MLIGRKELKFIMPVASDSRIDDFLLPINGTLDEFSITTPERSAAFLAQVAHESGQLMYTRELWGPTKTQSGYDNRQDLGNTRPEAIAISKWRNDTPGHLWRGAGLIQVTGYDNFLACSLALFKDDRALLHPEMLEEPYDATRSAGWFWDSRHLNGLADQPGTFRAITKKINGGLNGIQDREAYYARALKVLT